MKKNVMRLFGFFFGFILILGMSMTAMADTAQIGETKYASLATAIAAVQAGTETTIKMIADEVIEGNTGVTIPSDKKIILDLYGHTVSNAVNQNTHSQLINNLGDLTIQDSSTNKSGVLKNGIKPGTQPGEWWSTPQYNYATNVIKNSGKLTVLSGTILQTAAGSICYAVDNNSTSYDTYLFMKGGTLKDDYGTVVRMFCNSTVKNNVVEISGGNITTPGKAAIWTQLPGSNSSSMKKANLKITGGTITGGTWAWYDWSGGDGWDNVNYEISGGAMTGVLESDGKSKFITGGYYSVEPEEEAYNYCADGYDYVINPDNNGYAYKVVPSPVTVVSFDPGEGKGTMKPVKVQANKPFKLPGNTFQAPTGHVFAHWKIGEKEYPAGDTVTITGNTTILAVWVSTEKSELVKVETSDLKVVPEEVKSKFSTIQAITKELFGELLANGTAEFLEQAKLYDVKLMISNDNGRTWEEADINNFPNGGLEVLLGYPKGTGPNGWAFGVSHMFTETVSRLGTTAGDVETPPVIKTPNGLLVKLKGLSPVMISWQKEEVNPDSLPRTGDNSNVLIYVLIGVLSLTALTVMKKKKLY